MNLNVKELVPMLLTVLLATGSLASYMHLNFATAADLGRVEAELSEINAIALGNQIRAMMYEFCKDSSNPVLAEMIEKQRHKYQVRTGEVFRWVCTS